MSHALQRRLTRLFPCGNKTIWADMRKCQDIVQKASVAIIGLDFLLSAETTNLVAGKALLLDMDDGACIEDVIRSGADGLLCSTRLPVEKRALLTAQARGWNYPCVFDCRNLDLSHLASIRQQGFHAALLAPAHEQQRHSFCHYTALLAEA